MQATAEESEENALEGQQRLEYPQVTTGWFWVGGGGATEDTIEYYLSVN